MPLLVINSTKRSDCVSHIIDIKVNVTSKKPTTTCLPMYKFNFFIVVSITKKIRKKTKISHPQKNSLIC